MRAKEERKQREELEATLKLLEKNLLIEENQCLYDKCKRDLEEIYDNQERIQRLFGHSGFYWQSDKT